LSASTFLDVRRVPVSAPDEEALASFEAALETLYRYQGDPLAEIRETLERWPGFALAHIFRALVLLGFTERRFAIGAARSLETAAEFLNPADQREQTLYRVARSMLELDWASACRGLESLLLAHPRDMLALQVAHTLDFFRGDLWALRNRVNRVLPYWQPETPGYAHVLGMHAFGLEECNHYPEAEQAATSSLALDRANPWAVHALAHVLEMQGRVDEGIAHLESRVPDWSVDSGFAYHNWWHLALFHLDRGDEQRVLDLYDQVFGDPESCFALNMIDAAALLWRLKLLGVETGERSAPVAGWWREQIDSGGAYYAFNDFHAAIALALESDGEAIEQLLGRIAAEPSGADAGDGIHTIGAPLVRAIKAYVDRDFAACAEALAVLRDDAQRFGGSHAQRDLITLTLIDAAASAGRTGLARHYLNERLVMKPASPLGPRLEQRYALQSTLASA
jgi:hypothetical protein